ncbi:MAG: YeeE/YedE thiosulfate transporter family protein [Cellulosilyticaceae bacterium]
MQRAKLCFAAGIRDIILFKKTKVFRALLLGMLIATIGFTFYQYSGTEEIRVISGQVKPVGWHTVIGGMIFGIGMSIAGGCVSTIFIRLGEGYLLPIISLAGVFIGTGIVMSIYQYGDINFIYEKPGIYLADYLDIRYLMLIQIMALASFIYILYRYEKKNYK